MKKFIYLDQDSVNSYLAQIKKGLLVNCSNEKQSSEIISDSENLNKLISGKIGVKIFGANIFEFNPDLNGEIKDNTNSITLDENIKNRVEEKVLHDYSFEIVEEFLGENKLIKKNNFDTGDIILEEDEITIIDFDYFKNIFGNDGVMKKLISLNTVKNIVDNDINFLNKMIEIIRQLIPYKRFGICGNYLILFDDKNFRDNSDIIAFKYGGKMKFMGNVTNIISELDDSGISNLNNFKKFYTQINQGTFKMFLNTDKIYIVHAIALYYES